MQLAEINVARLTHPVDHPAVAGFVDNLERINGIAERTDGFVWRHLDQSGNATDTRIDPDPRVIVNLSVWRDVESLERFVWGTLHRQFYARRAEWFAALGRMHLAMWWIRDGAFPTIDEAVARLDHLDAHGPSPRAFGWADLPQAVRWREARCAPVAA